MLGFRRKSTEFIGECAVLTFSEVECVVLLAVKKRVCGADIKGPPIKFGGLNYDYDDF